MKTYDKIPLTLVATALAVGALLLAPPASEAQLHVGGQGSWGSETDLGVGARLLANVESANLEIVGSGNLFFPDGNIDYWEVNGNLFYHFHLEENPRVLPYVGGGLNISRVSNGFDNTEAGLNLGGGVRFPLENVSPFAELRTVLSDQDQTVFTIGLIFGHAHGR